MVEHVFEYYDSLEREKVKLVATKMCKNASIWWNNMKRQREKDGKKKIQTWAASFLIRVQQGFLYPKESYEGRTPRWEGLPGGKDSQAGRTPRREGLLLLSRKDSQAG